MKLSYYYYKHLASQLSLENKALARKPKSRSLLGLSVDLNEFIMIAESFACLQKDPLFVLRSALKSLPAGHGILGLLVQSCETLGAACASGYRFQHLSRSGMHSTLKYEENVVSSIVAIDKHDAEYVGLMVEYYQGSLVAIANYLVDETQPIRAQAVYFMHKPRAPLSAYRILFGCNNIYFSQTENKIVFDRKIMDFNIERSDGGAKQVLLTEAKAQLNSLLGKNSLADRLRQLLLEQQPFINLSVAQSAELLQLTESTLKRRLQQEETNYQAVLDDVLESLAKKYLMNEELSIQQISISLGFSDRSAFARSFKRWSGLSPLQYRKQKIL